MDNAELYHEANTNQFRVNAEIINTYGQKMTWQEGDMILDIGCGTGMVTTKLLLPMIPETSKLVAIDRLKEMIHVAKRNYIYDKIEFIVQDLCADNITNVIGEARFDKVFSFFSLHWIQDQWKAIENIWKVMKPGGVALLTLVTDSTYYEINQFMHSQGKWKEYTTVLKHTLGDVSTYISPYFGMKQPDKVFSKLLESFGFRIIECKLKDMKFTSPTIEKLKRNIEAISPSTKRIPDNFKEEFMDDCINFGLQNEWIVKEDNGEYNMPTKIMIVFCTKM